MEAGRYCSAVFLNTSQGSLDKVWHRKLLYKIKNRFLTDLYVIIRFYLHRTFRVKYGEIVTQPKKINSGVLLELAY